MELTNNAIFVKIVKSAKFVKSWKICKNLIFWFLEGLLLHMESSIVCIVAK